MADYNRSKSYSYSADRMELDSYYGPRSFSGYPNDFRSHSVSYGSFPGEAPPPPPPLPLTVQGKLKKGKSTNGALTKAWSFAGDPEFQRKKRVASYKVYSVEGKVKGSFRRSVRWIRNKYTQAVYGWW